MSPSKHPFNKPYYLPKYPLKQKPCRHHQPQNLSTSFQEKQLRESFFGKSHNRTIDNLMHNWDIIDKKPELKEKLGVMRDLELVNERVVQINTVKGKDKVRFIYNDYHQKNTNPGYSRNALGCFYTR